MEPIGKVQSNRNDYKPVKVKHVQYGLNWTAYQAAADGELQQLMDLGWKSKLNYLESMKPWISVVLWKPFIHQNNKGLLFFSIYIQI